MPASLLPLKGQWQGIANGPPEGGVLIILSPANTPSREILDKVVALIQARDHQVTTIAAERFD